MTLWLKNAIVTLVHNQTIMLLLVCEHSHCLTFDTYDIKVISRHCNCCVFSICRCAGAVCRVSGGHRDPRSFQQPISSHEQEGEASCDCKSDPTQYKADANQSKYAEQKLPIHTFEGNLGLLWYLWASANSLNKDLSSTKQWRDCSFKSIWLCRGLGCLIEGKAY